MSEPKRHTITSRNSLAARLTAQRRPTTASSGTTTTRATQSRDSAAAQSSDDDDNEEEEFVDHDDDYDDGDDDDDKDDVDMSVGSGSSEEIVPNELPPLPSASAGNEVRAPPKPPRHDALSASAPPLSDGGYTAQGLEALIRGDVALEDLSDVLGDQSPLSQSPQLSARHQPNVPRSHSDRSAENSDSHTPLRASAGGSSMHSAGTPSHTDASMQKSRSSGPVVGATNSAANNSNSSSANNSANGGSGGGGGGGGSKSSMTHEQDSHANKPSLLTRLRTSTRRDKETSPSEAEARADRRRVRELSAKVNKLFQNKKYDKALTLLWDMLKIPASSPIQDRIYFNIALCQTTLGNVGEALVALDYALAAGYNNWTKIQHDSHLLRLHNHPRFFELIEKYRSTKDDEHHQIEEKHQINSHLQQQKHHLHDGHVQQSELAAAAAASSIVQHHQQQNQHHHQQNVERKPKPLPARPPVTNANVAASRVAGSSSQMKSTTNAAAPLQDVSSVAAVVEPSVLAAHHKHTPIDANIQAQLPPINIQLQKLAESADRMALSGRAADARRIYFRMLELKPDRAATYVLWANLEASVGDKHEALRLLKIAAGYGFKSWNVVETHSVFKHVAEMPEYRDFRPDTSVNTRVISPRGPKNAIYEAVPEIPFE